MRELPPLPAPSGFLGNTEIFKPDEAIRLKRRMDELRERASTELKINMGILPEAWRAPEHLIGPCMRANKLPRIEAMERLAEFFKPATTDYREEPIEVIPLKDFLYSEAGRGRSESL